MIAGGIGILVAVWLLTILLAKNAFGQRREDQGYARGKADAEKTLKSIYDASVQKYNAGYFQAVKERDEYTAIAASRELKPLDLTPSYTRTVLWTGRQYANHPRQNLVALFEDLDACACFRAEAPAEVSNLSFTIHGRSSWIPWMQKFWMRRTDTSASSYVSVPTSDIGPFKFGGPLPRVKAEIEAFFTDPKHGFKHPDGTWFEMEGAAIVFHVDLTSRIVEVPVYVDGARVSSPQVQDEDRLRALVEVQVAEEVARQKRVQVPVRAWGGDGKPRVEDS